MNQADDLTGKRFGKWTVIERVPFNYDWLVPKVMWRIVCDCGFGSIKAGTDLRRSVKASEEPACCSCSKYLMWQRRRKRCATAP